MPPRLALPAPGTTAFRESVRDACERLVIEFAEVPSPGHFARSFSPRSEPTAAISVLMTAARLSVHCRDRFRAELSVHWPEWCDAFDLAVAAESLEQGLVGEDGDAAGTECAAADAADTRQRGTDASEAMGVGSLLASFSPESDSVRTGTPPAHALGAMQRLLPRYELLTPLGSGAYGSVFLARDTALSMPSVEALVAIKFVDAVTEGAAGELLAEAALARAVSHAGVARALDAGMLRPPGGPLVVYTVSDFVDGLPLHLWKATRPRDDSAVRIETARCIAEAVLACHGVGVGHGDLSPANIVVGRDGRPRLVDFGLASLLPGTRTSADPTPGDPSLCDPLPDGQPPESTAPMESTPGAAASPADPGATPDASARGDRDGDRRRTCRDARRLRELTRWLLRDCALDRRADRLLLSLHRDRPDVASLHGLLTQAAASGDPTRVAAGRVLAIGAVAATTVVAVVTLALILRNQGANGASAPRALRDEFVLGALDAGSAELAESILDTGEIDADAAARERIDWLRVNWRSNERPGAELLALTEYALGNLPSSRVYATIAITRPPRGGTADVVRNSSELLVAIRRACQPEGAAAGQSELRALGVRLNARGLVRLADRAAEPPSQRPE